VEIRSLSRLLGGSFQAFHSQAGVGDMYVTVSSLASKNYRYGKYFTNSIPAIPSKPICVFWKNRRDSRRPQYGQKCSQIPGKEKYVQPALFLRLPDIYEAGEKDAIRDMIIHACQYDKRNKEYIDVLSRIMYRILPNYWYRRDKSIFD